MQFDQNFLDLTALRCPFFVFCKKNYPQSAGPRASDLFGDPDSPTGTGYADAHHAGRQHLHMTTGTAPAMMPSKPGAFLRDGGGGAGGLGLGRRGVGGERVRAR